jgi:hypothetical protein
MLIRFITVVGVLLTLFSVGARPVAGHTAGTIQLVSVSTGDFLLTVWTAPDPVRVGELHVIVGVTMAADGTVVLDDELHIEVTASSGLVEPLSDRATRANSDNKFLYEANLAPPEAAWYQVRLDVGHPQHQGGEATFNVEVLPAAGPNWLPIALLLLLLLGPGTALFIRRRRGAGRGSGAPAPVR